MESYTAKDIHRCFPWIAGSTLHDRVRSGLIPCLNVEASPGTGTSFEFSMAALVHSGGVDELLSLGFLKSGRSGTSLMVDFIRKDQPSLHFDDPNKEIHKAAVRFYEQCAYYCAISVSVLHEKSRRNNILRRKRASRILYVAFTDKKDGEFLHQGTFDGREFIVFSTAKIDVWQIYNHVRFTLGI